MEAYKLKGAYAEWVNKENYDLFITLNTEAELTYEQMSELMCKLFYKTECDVFGKNKNSEWRRELYKYKDKFHIKRLVVIEHYNKRTHAHIQVTCIFCLSFMQSLFAQPAFGNLNPTINICRKHV